MPSNNKTEPYVQFSFISAGGNLSVYIPGYIETSSLNGAGCYMMNTNTGGVTGLCTDYSDTAIFNQVDSVAVSPSS